MKVVLLDDWEYSSLNSQSITKLKQYHSVVAYHDRPTEEELIERIRDAEIIIPIRERTKFPKKILESMEKIRLIAQTGSGVAHIGMNAAKELGINVVRTTGGSMAVVELIIGYILCFSRQLFEFNREVKQGLWRDTFGKGLQNKTIGIIGLGKIGSRVATIAKAFGMNVLAWGPRLTKERANEQDVTFSSLEHLLQQSDYITVNVRRVPETINLITSEHFGLMKKGAFFINTSRGDIVEENALIEALEKKQIAGAGLDVFINEPIQKDHPLTRMNNVILTPHVGWKTDNTIESFFSESVENILTNHMNNKNGVI
ncbi:D-2-hydroxyacid dehydrogenase family protein [Anaerobacillus sp. MEB173]|uniref:D-2-hydroxyacid dehydrogenase family protein n=1 Tax=Anaerobacillus sp. MEB173 TaxID=3383345 RepID=UPI003F8DD80B